MPFPKRYKLSYLLPAAVGFAIYMDKPLIGRYTVLFVYFRVEKKHVTINDAKNCHVINKSVFLIV